MAELNTSAPKAGGSRGANRKSTRVDLTAMVDLAFLLITFFMLTTTLSKPHAMALVMPDKEGPEHFPLAASRTMTICLGTNNKAIYFVGLADQSPVIAPTVVDYSKSGLRQAIIEAKEKVQQQSGKKMIVVIKPSDHSVYNDTVDVLDEMDITDVQQYAIVDTQPADIALLKSKGLY